MKLQSGLKRIYVVLAAIWGVFWLVLVVVGAFLDHDTPLSVRLLMGLGLILASPLIYLALVGLTTMVTWVIAGFKTERPQP